MPPVAALAPSNAPSPSAPRPAAVSEKKKVPDGFIGPKDPLLAGTLETSPEDSRLMKNLLFSPCHKSYIATLKGRPFAASDKGRFELLPWLLFDATKNQRPILPLARSDASGKVDKVLFVVIGMEGGSLKGDAARWFDLSSAHSIAVLNHMRIAAGAPLAGYSKAKLHPSVSALVGASLEKLHVEENDVNATAWMTRFGDRLSFSFLVLSPDAAKGPFPGATDSVLEAYIGSAAKHARALRTSFTSRARDLLAPAAPAAAPSPVPVPPPAAKAAKAAKAGAESDSEDEAAAQLSSAPKPVPAPSPNKRPAAAAEQPPAKKKKSAAAEKPAAKPKEKPAAKPAANKRKLVSGEAVESDREESPARAQESGDSDDGSESDDSAASGHGDQPAERKKRKIHDSASEDEASLNGSGSDSGSEDDDDEESDEEDDSEEEEDEEEGEETASKPKKRLVKAADRPQQQSDAQPTNEGRGEDTGGEEEAGEEEAEGDLAPRIVKNGSGRSKRRDGEKRQPARENRSGIATSMTSVLEQIAGLNDHVPVAHADRLKARTDETREAMVSYVTNGKVPSVYKLLTTQNQLVGELATIVARLGTAPAVASAAENRKIGIEASRLFVTALPALEDLATAMGEVCAKMNEASGTVNSLLNKTNVTALELAKSVTAFEMPARP